MDVQEFPLEQGSDGVISKEDVKDESINEMEKKPFSLSNCHSGLNIVPECEVILDGEGDPGTRLKDCKKHPGHKSFVPVKEFTLQHLPEHLRTEEAMALIRFKAERTVCIQVKYTSLNRPNTFYDSKASYPHIGIKGSSRAVRYGTGSITDYRKTEPKIGVCPCQDCKTSANPHKKYWEFTVTTATHVIYDDSEAERAIIKCFYDSEEDQQDVVTLFGVKVQNALPHEEIYWSDCCDNLMCVTHDEVSANKVASRINALPYRCSFISICDGYIVSHPHGCSKMISIGKMIDMTLSVTKPTVKVKSKHSPKRLSPFSASTEERLKSICPRWVEFRKSHSLTRVRILGRRKIVRLGLERFFLSADAKFAVKYHFAKKHFTFPSGTKCITKHPTYIPDDSEFQCNSFFKDYPSHYRVAYDIATCPGSSGALVSNYCFDWSGMHRFFTHSGVNHETKRNISGIATRSFPSRYLNPYLERLLSK